MSFLAPSLQCNPLHGCNTICSIFISTFIAIVATHLQHNNIMMSFSEYVGNSIATSGGVGRGSIFKGDQTSWQEHGNCE
jgi:hypothetical protein